MEGRQPALKDEGAFLNPLALRLRGRAYDEVCQIKDDDGLCKTIKKSPQLNLFVMEVN